MRNYFKLTLFLLKCGLGSAEKKKKSKFGNMGNKGVFLLVGVCLLPVFGMMFTMGREGYKLFAPVGMEQMIIQLICIAGAMVIFFLGLSMVISVFYMTSDIQDLLALPLSASQIVAAKSTVALLYEYMWIAFFVAPVLVGYGVEAQAGVLYWVYALIGCLILPIVPLVYAGVIAMIAMRLFKGIRNKDILSMVGFAFTMVFALGINGAAQFVTRQGGDNILALLQDHEGLINTVGYLFPNFRFLSGALAQESILHLLLFAATSAVFVIVFLLVAKILYLPAVLGMSEASDKKKVMTKAEKAKANRQRNPVYSYMMIELKKLMRTPIYFFNCVLMCIIWPLILGIPILFSLMGGGFALGTIFRSSEVSAVIEAFLGKDVSFGIVIMAVCGVTMFVSSMNMTTATSISREGKNFYIMKCIPMSYRDQIKAKVASGSVISFLGTVFYIVIIESILVFLGMNFLIIPLSIFICIVSVLLLNYIQMLLDLAYPKLTWETEAAAVKQNFHASLGVFIGLGIGLLLCGAAFAGYQYLNIQAYILIPVFTVVLTAVTVLLRYITYAYGEKCLAALED